MEQLPSPKAAMDVDRLVGGNIAALRRAKGMSQAAPASILGVTFQQVQKYEAGRNRVSAARLSAVAGEFGVPVAVLFGGPDTEDEAGTSLSFLRDPQVAELLRTFTAIADAAARRETLALVRSVARVCGGGAA